MHLFKMVKGNLLALLIMDHNKVMIFNLFAKLDVGGKKLMVQ